MALCHAQIHEVNLNLSRSLNMIWVLSSGITVKIKLFPESCFFLPSIVICSYETAGRIVLNGPVSRTDDPSSQHSTSSHLTCWLILSPASQETIVVFGAGVR